MKEATQTNEQVAVINAQTFSDLKNAVFITSVFANLYMLTAFLVINLS